MERVEIVPLKKPIDVDVILPGCLSYTIRAMALAAETAGRVKIVNALKSDDTYAMFRAFKTLGIRCEEKDDSFVFEGDVRDVKEGSYEINIGISGRAARTLLAFLCVVPGKKILTCEEGFKERPVGDLVDALSQLGAKIEYLERPGFLPVAINSSQLRSGKLKLRGEMSSQFVSAILMVAPLVGNMEIEVVGEQASKPFIDMTIEIMGVFGVKVENNNYRSYVVKGGQGYKNETYFVEPDAIAASYFWSIAALTRSRIKILHLDSLSKQGDVRYADILGKMGCVVRKDADGIEVEGAGKLRGLEIDMNDMPDTVQTLAVTAAFAEGKTLIKGIKNLKIKETDRIEATRKELARMGVDVESGEDFLSIKGGGAFGAMMDTYGDHRMAMAFAVAGARIPGVVINNPEVVGKSFPGFWEKLRELGIELRVEN